MGKEVDIYRKAGALTSNRGTFTGNTGKGLVTAGAGLAVGHFILAVLPFVGAGLLGPWFLPLAMIIFGLFMWE